MGTSFFLFTNNTDSIFFFAKSFKLIKGYLLAEKIPKMSDALVERVRALLGGPNT
jgi:hypothetical protein